VFLYTPTSYKDLREYIFVSDHKVAKSLKRNWLLAGVCGFTTQYSWNLANATGIVFLASLL
jgi:hypothetical protein